MGRRIPDIDWKAVAVFVITNEHLSIADASRELEIPYEAIRSRAKRGKWLRLREERLRKLEGEIALIPPDPITGSRRLKLYPDTGAESQSDSQPFQQITEIQDVKRDIEHDSSLRKYGSSRSATVSEAVIEGLEIIASETRLGEKDSKKRSIEEMAADVWAKRKHEHKDTVYQFAHGAFKGAASGKDKLRPPKNYKDLDIVDKMARRAAGLEDKEDGNSVNIMIQLGALNGALKPA